MKNFYLKKGERFPKTIILVGYNISKIKELVMALKKENPRIYLTREEGVFFTKEEKIV